jgi:hypothetical protein
MGFQKKSGRDRSREAVKSMARSLKSHLPPGVRRVDMVTKNEVLTGLNKPEDWWLAVVLVDGERVTAPASVRRPFQREPDFAAVCVNYELRHVMSEGGRVHCDM